MARKKNLYEWCIENNRKDILDLWDEELNHRSPHDVYPYSKEKMWWRCKKCGLPWDAVTYHIINYRGCPRCCNPPKLPTPGVNDLASQYPDVAKEWDYEKNDPIVPEQVLQYSNKKFGWICSKCGRRWDAVVDSRTKDNRGCNYCRQKIALEKRKKGYLKDGNTLADKNPELSDTLHPALNGGLTGKDISPKSNKKRYWVCQVCGYGNDGEWYASPNTRLNSDCPRCGRRFKSSKGDMSVYYYVSKLIPSAEHRAHPDFLNGKEIDVYVPEIGIGIEYDGRVYHGDIYNTSLKDLQKTKDCSDNGIELIHIREEGLEPVLDAINFFVDPRDPHSLDVAIQNVLDIVSKKTGAEQDFKVDTKKDQMEILSDRINTFKEDSLQNKRPDIAKTWHPTKNGKQTPSMVSFGSHTMAYWLCPDCNYGDKEDWQMEIKVRIRQGCPRCSNRVITPGVNDLASRKPKIALQWDYDKNPKERNPTNISPKNGTKYWWKCPKCGQSEFVETYSRANNGCPYCSNPPKKVLAGFNDLATKRPEVAKYWDYENNGITKPSDVFPFSHEDYWWKCPKCEQSFKAAPANMKKEFKCRVCGKEITAVIPEYNSFLARHPECEKYLDKDSVERARNISEGSNKKLKFRCSKGHLFIRKPYEFLKLKQCPVCSNKELLKGYNDLASHNPEVAKEFHHYLNGELRPDQILYGAAIKVWWKCSNCGHEWKARVVDRTRSGSGCAHCKRGAPIHIEYKGDSSEQTSLDNYS